MRKLKITLMLLSLIIGSATLMGQVTTSSLTGTISDENGDPMAGATIVATHVPSGTVYGAIANSVGLYSIQGMRPGGPYTVN
ncbi:MAG TPA: carboxypeptidase-like regulatory domain-containing protein, partial [Bacteroidales bacterium]|nr:carboxypeptidase-like regulatory domain-containing protein [Bacteroidales bacterium]